MINFGLYKVGLPKVVKISFNGSKYKIDKRWEKIDLFITKIIKFTNTIEIDLAFNKNKQQYIESLIKFKNHNSISRQE